MKTDNEWHYGYEYQESDTLTCVIVDTLEEVEADPAPKVMRKTESGDVVDVQRVRYRWEEDGLLLDFGHSMAKAPYKKNV